MVLDENVHDDDEEVTGGGGGGGGDDDDDDGGMFEVASSRLMETHRQRKFSPFFSRAPS